MAPLRHPRSPSPRIFRPPHCPNRHCPDYTPRPSWRPRRDGFFRRPSDRRRFQRFRCPRCRRRFSSRTFAPDYWLRLRSRFPLLAQLACEGPALRQSARLLQTSHATVMRHLARAGRHCLLLHRELLPQRPLREPLVMDGFETFEHSQFFPFHLNLAVGAHSWLLYHFTDSPLRRKGAMTEEQKRRRSALEELFGRPHPRAVEEGMVELLEPMLRGAVRSGDGPGQRQRVREGAEAPRAVELWLYSDDHPAYRRALRRIRRRHPRLRLHHQVTSSRERRTVRNPLFPVNLADLLLRHGQAAHRRETIAFCKRRQGALERLAVFTVWRNLIKRRREKQAGETAAMAAGIVDRPWSWGQVFRSRKFPRRRWLPGPWWQYYWGRVKTAALGTSQRTHRLKYAF